ncbi:MAG: hypothetical protein HYV28_10215 [Ignavibacteriales bacterium]|nr:hypothetical protein [Ignavibacteriales bacterium]
MKFLFILFITASLFAQSPVYQDTIVLYSGKTYPCFISKLNGDNITMTYLRDISIDANLKTVSSIYLNTLGIVYTQKEGYIKPIKEIEKLLNERNELIEETAALEKNIAAVSRIQPNTIDPPLFIEQPKVKKVQVLKTERPWSFGVYWYPSTEVSIPSFYYSDYSGFSYSINRVQAVRMDGDFAYKWIENLTATVSFGITSMTNNLTQVRTTTSLTNPPSFIKNSVVNENSVRNIDIAIGARYTFWKTDDNRSEVMAFFSIGKQFSNSTIKISPISTEYDTPTEQMEKQTEGQNSPFHITFGIRSEYFFNESISLCPIMNFNYSSTTVEYFTSQANSQSTKTINDISKENSYFSTEFGIGLNFHF